MNERTITDKKKIQIKLLLLLLSVLVIVGINVCINLYRINKIVYIMDSDEYSYQVEELSFSDKSLVLNGWFFQLERSKSGFTGHKSDGNIGVYLKEIDDGLNDTDEVRGSVKITKRDDVNNYFACEYDYSNSGFIASFDRTQIDATKVYQVVVKPNINELTAIKVNAYVFDGRLFYTNPYEYISLDVKETDLERIVCEGICLVSRPDYSISIYQYDHKLYWIFDGAKVDESSTRLLCQVTTTQFERLPLDRINHGWFWDDLSEWIGACEITSDINAGAYRACVMDLPKDYSVNSLTLGYYIRGQEDWIWSEVVRPHYDFGR